MERIPLVVFSHLRWDFVYHRPQHVMTRLAQRRPVLFVEEPVLAESPWLELRMVAERVRLCRPHLPICGQAFGSEQERTLTELLGAQLERDRWTDFAAWLYTPMPVRIARALNARAFVYDCMDELSAFLGVPPEMIERERELLSIADVVLTGGPSLYRSKRERHPFVRCFPCSVDVDHFARGASVPEPEDHIPLPSPRFGYFGVIDERIDLELVAAVADEWPEGAVVMVGPVVKIDPATLPQRHNIHYMGPRSYEDLPAYAASWDVCMMPFAQGATTRFISPTKVLEYMAADRPIATTSIRDVVEPYGDIVYAGDGPKGFLDACLRALEDGDEERQTRRVRAAQVLRRSSWDETARRMDEILRYVADSGQSRMLLNAAAAGK